MKYLIQQSAVIALSIFSLPLEAAYYRWTDENGKTHYSYSVPADKAKLGHTVLDKQGIAHKKVISSKRKKQLEEIARLREEEEKQAAIARKKKKVQDAEDNLLLSVFSSEDELTKAL